MSNIQNPAAGDHDDETPMTFEEYEAALRANIEGGDIKCILVGQTLKLIMPENIKPHHHVLSVAESLRRLNLDHSPEPAKSTLIQRFVRWVRR